MESWSGMGKIDRLLSYSALTPARVFILKITFHNGNKYKPLVTSTFQNVHFHVINAHDISIILLFAFLYRLCSFDFAFVARMTFFWSVSSRHAYAHGKVNEVGLTPSLVLYKSSLLQAVAFFSESDIFHEGFRFYLEVNRSGFEPLFSWDVVTWILIAWMWGRGVGVQDGCLSISTQIIASFLQRWDI